MGGGREKSKDVCPHCGGAMEEWWFSDHYDIGSGVTCENEERMHCSDTLAWQTYMEEKK